MQPSNNEYVLFSILSNDLHVHAQQYTVALITVGDFQKHFVGTGIMKYAKGKCLDANELPIGMFKTFIYEPIMAFRDFDENVIRQSYRFGPMATVFNVQRGQDEEDPEPNDGEEVTIERPIIVDMYRMMID